MFNNMIQQKAKIFSSTTKGLQNACKKKKKAHSIQILKKEQKDKRLEKEKILKK